MKSLLIALFLVGATVTYAGDASKKDSCAVCKKAKAAAKPKVKATVTGSNIPVEVDQNGRPAKSTLKVSVVDENAIRLYGFGSPSSALGRLPMVYSRR